jgi:DNA-directed RNA polymerase subunit RPC12/RpoP
MEMQGQVGLGRATARPVGDKAGEATWSCAQCGTIITYSLLKVGQTTECPNCKSTVTLPAPPSGKRMGMAPPKPVQAPQQNKCPKCGAIYHPSLTACPICIERRRFMMLILCALAAAGVIAGIYYGALALRRHWDTTRLAWPPIQPGVAHTGPGETPKGTMYIAPPVAVVVHSGITYDLFPKRFTLEWQPDSDVGVVAGDVVNTSTNTYREITARLDLLDKTGARIASLSSFTAFFGPNSIWHIVESTTNRAAISVRVADLRQGK